MSCAFCEPHVPEPAAVTYPEFLKEVEFTWNSLESSLWRRGQTIMNVLYRTHPKLHEQLSQGPDDPFFLDTRIDACLKWLKERMPA